MSKPFVVGLVGKARAGKSTLAADLMPFLGAVEIAFADALKEEVCQFYGVDLRTLNERKNETWDYDWYNVPVSVPPYTRLTIKTTARAILQWWGTEYRRGQDPEYWIKAWRKRLPLNPCSTVIASDVRFQNEADECDILIRVEAVEAEPLPGGHESENVDGIVCHYHYPNQYGVPRELAMAIIEKRGRDDTL